MTHLDHTAPFTSISDTFQSLSCETAHLGVRSRLEHHFQVLANHKPTRSEDCEDRHNTRVFSFKRGN